MSQIKTWGLLFGLIGIIFITNSCAQIIDNDFKTKKTQPILPAISEIVWDTFHQIEIDSILFLSKNNQTQYNEPINHSFGITSSALWLRLNFPDDVSDEKSLLVVDNPSLFIVDLYIIQNGSVERIMNSGNGVSPSDRPLDHRILAFPFQPESNYTYWVKVVAGDEMIIPMKLMSQNSFLMKSETESSWLGFYYGFMGVLILAVISFYITTTNTLFLYTALYLFFATAFTMGLDRFAMGWITPLTVYLQGCEHAIYAAIAGSSFLVCFNLNINYPISTRASKIKRVLVYSFILFSVSLILCPLLPTDFVPTALFYLKICIWILFVPNITWIVYHIFSGFLKSRKTMKFMLLSALALMTGLGLQLAEYTGLFPRILPFPNSYIYAGLSGFAFFLLIGLGEKFREISNSREQVLKEKLISADQVLRLNEQLEIINSTLEEKVAQRTQQLNEARIRAEEGSHAKASFLATMSHEIRTPMNGIIGMADMLMETQLDADQQEQLRIIQGSGASLLTIINDILDFSKIESGKLELEYIDFSFKQCIEDVFALLRPKADEKALSLTHFYDPNIREYLKGDPVRLKQILINLINNAIKFTHIGGIEVVIRFAKDELNYQHIQVSIIDSGIGIPKEKISQLFQAFEQVDSSTTREYGGTGLGLAISRRLCTLMGGEIWVESDIGKGSSFHFTFKTEAGQESKSQKENSSFALSKASTSEKLADSYPFKILVAEDNIVNQKVIQRILKKFGYTIDIAENGVEAVEFASKGIYDLIFMDMQMPKMDGLEATRTIIQMIKADAPIIVAMTANAMEKDRMACLEAGMQGYIAKPIRPKILEEELIRWGMKKPSNV